MTREQEEIIYLALREAGYHMLFINPDIRYPFKLHGRLEVCPICKSTLVAAAGVIEVRVRPIRSQDPTNPWAAPRDEFFICSDREACEFKRAVRT